jgi:hypothetical protein
MVMHTQPLIRQPLYNSPHRQPSIITTIIMISTIPTITITKFMLTLLPQLA